MHEKLGRNRYEQMIKKNGRKKVMHLSQKAMQPGMDQGWGGPLEYSNPNYP